MVIGPTKVALVTAGSNGVGAAIAKTLALEANMSIVINFHSDSTRAENLVNQLTEERKRVFIENIATPRFTAIRADVGRRDEIRRLVAETVRQMGRLDVVVSNAGWTRMTDFMNLQQADEEEDWDRCFNMNVKSHFFLFQACKEHLGSSKGVFITTASVAGVIPSGSSLPYSVTKSALIHLTKGLAIIAAPNVRVNSVAPGVLLTDWGRQFPEAKLNSVKEKSALKRFATPEDVAQMVKYFALAQSVTGQNSVIDAGFSL
ncbi:NAD(P)-binding protein [Lophiostoma macrostomum CBS 122681]|uniref:NAD(P)-binding protein n=1 Tax=Lophiostoma macrostomum CBS 122681 TaxID=1314788 RepID=A0A6A6SKZ7_9PLEO|nr:NAD(P)-binding protein [Lophiostoma macrostomum CBS 122681]